MDGSRSSCEAVRRGCAKVSIQEALMRTLHLSLALAFVVAACSLSSPVQATSGGIQVIAQGVEGEQFDPFKVYHALDGRFVNDDNGVVTDTKTGLKWFVGPDRDTTWDDAKSWVENLSVDGSGWRMPTREELRSLFKKGAGAHNMSPLFKTTGEFVWTGETMGTRHAWGFCFGIGSDYWPLRTWSEEARGTF
jgi:hypothetical protein